MSVMAMTTDADQGTLADRGSPRRRCIATGRERDRARLVRFVAAPDGTVVPDIQAVLPGRGTWVTADREHIERVSAEHGALWRVGRVPDGLVDQIDALLAARCQSFIGLARRAGQLVVGFDRVRALLAARRVGAVVTAMDAAEDGRAKIDRLGAAVLPDVPTIDVMTRFEMGAAIGRAESVHMALQPGRLADQLVGEAARLARFRRQDPSAIGSDIVREAGAE